MVAWYEQGYLRADQPHPTTTHSYELGGTPLYKRGEETACVTSFILRREELERWGVVTPYKIRNFLALHTLYLNRRWLHTV